MKLFEKDWYWRKWVVIINWLLPKQIAERIILIHKIKSVFNYTFHKKLSIKHPKDFNEKLIWLSLYWQHPLKSICADKYKVRDYVTKTCGLPESLLVPLLGVYDTGENIDFAQLPNEFVLKCNHGCAFNILVKDKSKLKVKTAIKQLNDWLDINYSGSVAEFHYDAIKEHLILCEKYLDSTGYKDELVDYKIFCFNGRPDFVQLCFDRDEETKAQHATFSFDWRQLYYTKNEKDYIISRPRSLDKMIEYATVLSKDFPFVRVDFYEIDNECLLGELTFTPFGNMLSFYNDDVLDVLGEKLQLPPKYKDRDAY